METHLDPDRVGRRTDVGQLRARPLRSGFPERQRGRLTAKAPHRAHPEPVIAQDAAAAAEEAHIAAAA
ncbi:hypothetical protein DEF23_21410 [Marinitenerispora sediminis]|uniref:Uncharacterized protein n=1 Tax=Marinitenerispora sediminis TaxID=1931232 RepID=A0A368SZ66_9ACTN|nr:hypothetical protein DEF28_22755 [Marinitenerispora sediminis]RCV50604.1 hypothetical protein DEF24_24025 [Marinitenerispora sediminis]RCV50879.1 hypothetical protein DEF23_21410 [Marinitenerispora sediminis]